VDDPGRSSTLADGFRLAGWSIDPAGNLLSSDAGSVRISPRATKVLLALAERPGRVIARQELLATCWAAGFVGEEVLTHIDGLWVVSKTSSLRFHRTELDVRSIGRHLAADVVIEGSVRRFRRGMRIAVQLVDTDSGYHLGSASYDREFDDVFQVQAEIAHRVVDHLHSRLDAGGRPAAQAMHRPRRPIAPSVEAYRPVPAGPPPFLPRRPGSHPASRRTVRPRRRRSTRLRLGVRRLR
jgi:TolB-like protein